MTAPVSIELEARPLERLSCDLVVAGLFVGDRPLRGGAARIDWRACGLLSQLVIAGRLRGEVGEALLLPSEGALRSPRALLLGLGDRAGFSIGAAKDAFRTAIDHCFQLGVSRAAIAPLGFASDDLPRHAPAIVGGMVEVARADSRELAVLLSLPRSEHPAASQALERALRAVDPAPVTLRAAPPSPARTASSPRGDSARPI